MNLRKFPTEKVTEMRSRYLSKAYRCDVELRRRETEAESPCFSMFSDTSRRLLIEMWDAPNRTISHQDVREDVIGDVDASLSAIWSVIFRTKKEFEGSSMYIENVRGRGYRLVLR